MDFSVEPQRDSFVPDASNKRLLRDALGQFCTGIAIVTASTPEGPAAITINSFSSVSLTPALVLWSIDRGCSRYKSFTEAPHYSIHVLDQSQDSLCMDIARNPEFIKHVPMRLNSFGVPVFDCLARFDCTPEAQYEAGDHDIIVGLVKLATMPVQSAPLIFFGGATATIAEHSGRTN